MITSALFILFLFLCIVGSVGVGQPNVGSVEPLARNRCLAGVKPDGLVRPLFSYKKRAKGKKLPCWQSHLWRAPLFQSIHRPERRVPRN